MSSGYITKKYLLDNLKLFKKNVLDKIYVPITRTVNGKSLSANISLSPSDIGASPTGHTHTKSEIGLGNVGNFKAVSTVANQGLTDTEKSNARANIGAQVAGSYASSTHNHDDKYQAKGSYASASHTHDDRYYTESEIDSKLGGKASSTTLDNNVNLNNITTPGFYNCGGANSLVNKPSNVDAVGLIVTHNASGSYYTQILTTSSNSNTYRRTCSNSTWSAWTQDKYTDTNTWRGIQDNLTSDSATDSLSAKQGKALKTLIDAKTSNTGTITGIKMNGASKGTSGVVDLGTVLTGGKQSTTSTADGGANVYTFSDGSTITVKNGSKGSTGATGSPGAAGKNGSNGTSAAWFSGTAVTGTSTSAVSVSVSGSKAGDMYLNTSTANVYRASAANSWVYVCNIKGATGAQGARGATGAQGATGAAGKNGTNGVSCTHSWNGTTLTVTSASGSSSANLKGDKGDRGATGANGSNGVTPTIKVASGSAIGSVGTPSVTASTSGTTTTFTFNYLKGAKGDKGDPGANATTTAVATTSANGLMSKDMVTKLNGIASGATAVTSTTVSNWGFKKTDTNTWRGVQNNLTSTATDQSLSAYQGKVLRDMIHRVIVQSSEPAISTNDEWLLEY